MHVKHLLSRSHSIAWVVWSTTIFRYSCD